MRVFELFDTRNYCYVVVVEDVEQQWLNNCTVCYYYDYYYNYSAAFAASLLLHLFMRCSGKHLKVRIHDSMYRPTSLALVMLPVYFLAYHKNVKKGKVLSAQDSYVWFLKREVNQG